MFPTILHFKSTDVHLPSPVLQNVHFFRLSGKVAEGCPLLKMMPDYEETLQRDAVVEYRKIHKSGVGECWKICCEEGKRRRQRL